jgi:hypothetical protein
VRPSDPHRRHRLRLSAGAGGRHRPRSAARDPAFRDARVTGLYHRGWKAVTYHPVGPLYGDGLSPNAPFDEDVWELYHVAEDLSETRDLAAENPDRVAEMVEPGGGRRPKRNQVLPLDNRVLWVITNPKPHHRRERSSFRYFPGGAQVPEPVAVNVRNRSHAMTVKVEVAEGTVPSGVLLALGSALGGWSFHLLDGRLRYVHNLYGKRRYVIETDDILGPGSHTLRFSFEKDDKRGGDGVLQIDGAVVAEGVIRSFTPAGFNGVGVGLTCGYEWGPAVGDGYQAPFPFNGTITHAVVEATGPVVRDPLAELAAIMSEQ